VPQEGKDCMGKKVSHPEIDGRPSEKCGVVEK